MKLNKFMYYVAVINYYICTFLFSASLFIEPTQPNNIKFVWGFCSIAMVLIMLYAYEDKESGR